MQKLYYYIATLYWTVLLVSCEKCLDPYKSNFLIPGKAKLNPNPKQYTDQPIVFPEVRLYNLSESPLVQYVLLGSGDDVLVLRLKQPYPDPPRTHWNTDYSGTIQFDFDFADTPKNDEQVKEILKRYGTFRNRALREMKENCDFIILQECFEKILRSLMIAAIAMMCYTVYSIFNFLVNYSTLRKTGKRTMVSAFCALSNALTGRYIFKHQKQEIQKIHLDLYEEMTKQEQKLKTLEESLRFCMILAQKKKMSDSTYDYILPEMKKFTDNLEGKLENMEIVLRPSNNVRNSQKSGYLTPINHHVM